MGILVLKMSDLVGNDTNRHDTAGAISHYDGSSWVQQSPAYDFLYGIWGSSMTDVFAVGGNGAIQHFDGTSWHAMSGEFTSIDFDVAMEERRSGFNCCG